MLRDLCGLRMLAYEGTHEAAVPIAMSRDQAMNLYQPEPLAWIAPTPRTKEQALEAIAVGERHLVNEKEERDDAEQPATNPD